MESNENRALFSHDQSADHLHDDGTAVVFCSCSLYPHHDLLYRDYYSDHYITGFWVLKALGLGSGVAKLKMNFDEMVP
jgi:hypothetical protein